MWLQPSPWPLTSKLCSGKDGEDILVDGAGVVRYAQKQENTGFFMNVTRLCLPPGSCDTIRGRSRWQRHPAETGFGGKRP